MRTRSRLAAAAIVAAAVLLAPAAARAVDPDQVGSFARWSIGGGSGAFTATPSFPAAAGFPATTLTSTSTTLTTASGASAFLGASTDFGAEFGSTRSQPYLTIAPGAGNTNSTTTLSFASAPADGWGFALGDIDADWAFIQAYTGPGLTNPLTVDQLGFRSVGNYCGNSPRPSTCGSGVQTDAPVWVTATETFDGITYVPGTLRGNSLPGNPNPTRDTSGAYGWFVPTVPVQTLQITFGIREGFPTTQFWLAAPAPKVIVTGTVTPPPGQQVPAGTVVQVNESDGTPVLGIEDEPLTVPVDPATGTFSVELPQEDAGYELQVIPPAGYATPAPVQVAGVPDDPVTLTVTAPPVAIQPLAAEPSPSPSATGPALADSGGSDAVWWTAGLGAALLTLGVALRTTRRRA